MNGRPLSELISSYKNRVSIDEFALERELREQPLLYLEIAEIASQLKADSKQAKAELDLVKAKAGAEIRENPDKFGIAKVTEAAITAAITTHKSVVEAGTRLLDLEADADIFSSILSAAEQRKSMLRDLVSLYIHKYYSDINGRKVETGDALLEAREDAVARSRSVREENGDHRE